MQGGARSIGTARALAVLLPAALLLHELVYLLGPGAAPEVAHGYLATAIPVVAAAAVLLALLGVVAPLLGFAEAETEPGRLPLLLAAVLAAAFGAQELTEALLLGGGLEAAAAALAAAWSLPPLALALGAVCAAVFVRLRRAAAAIARRFGAARSGPPGRRETPRPAPVRPFLAPMPPLAFGVARRPPPLRV